MGRPQRNELARRQQQLLIRSAELRVALAHEVRDLQTSLSVADQVMAGAQWLRQHPLLPLLAVALLALRRPRRALRWASRLLWGWGLYQRARDWLGGAAAKQA
jgi:hypothetical protein